MQGIHLSRRNLLKPRPTGVSLIQDVHAVDQGGAGPTATFGVPATAGNLLVAIHGNQDGGTPTRDGWFLAGTSGIGSARTTMWYKTAIGGETSLQITTGTAFNEDLSLSEYSGTSAANFISPSALSSNGAFTPDGLSSGSVILSGMGLLICGLTVVYNVTTFDNAWTNGFIRREMRESFFETAHLITPSGGSFSTFEDWSGGNTAGTMVLAGFAAA